MPKERGFFITLEGPEGSGKSTQARWLVQRFRRAGHHVVWLQDPGSTSLGRETRQLLLHTSTPLSPLAEALLFIGGRVQLVDEQIRPALAKGSVVVCDRFHDSTVVYQGYGGGVNVPWLDQLGRRAIHGVMPQLTIVLDVPMAKGFARLRRSHDRMERKTRLFHEQVRRGYVQLAKRDPRRITVIDASASATAVREQIDVVLNTRMS